MEFINEINADVIQQGAGMLVFVPEMLENVGDFARQIYTLATEQHRWVLYLTLDGQPSNHLADARQLATLTALTQGNSVQTGAVQSPVGDSTEALRQFTHPGDLVIWPEEQWLAPASLEEALGITQQVLPVNYTSPAPQTPPWFYSVLFWLLGLIVIVGFSYFEITLAREISGTPMKIVFISLLAVETGILYQLNRFFS